MMSDVGLVMYPQRDLEEALAALRETRGGEGLLEEVERVVVVEDLDRRADGRELLRARLLDDVEELRLLRAALLELSQVRGVIRERLLGVGELLLRVHDVHRDLDASALSELDRWRLLKLIKIK